MTGRRPLNAVVDGPAGSAESQPSDSILSRASRRAVSDLGVDMAAIVLGDGQGSWEVVDATSLVATALLQQSFVLGEGPCYEVLYSGKASIEVDLSWSPDGRPWPLWCAEARAVGVRSCAAFPIRAGALAAGVLLTFSAVPGRPRPHDLAAGQRLADASFAGLLDLQAGLDTDAANSGSAEVFDANVHVAAGMVMGQAGVSIGEALVRLRAHAFGAGRGLDAVADDVLAGRLIFCADGGTNRG